MGAGRRRANEEGLAVLRLVLRIASLATACLAVAGVAAAGERVSVTVEPATPGATTPVTVSFIAKQSPDPGTAWYGVEVTSTTRNRSCEHSEDAQVAPAQAGKRVNVTLRPVDKRRWCAGSYVGEVTYERRAACGDRIDEGVCSEPTSVGRFRFRVV
jgi:hypothetical protein